MEQNDADEGSEHSAIEHCGDLFGWDGLKCFKLQWDSDTGVEWMGWSGVE